MKDKKRIIQDSTEMIEMLTDTTELDQEIEDLNDELLVISELLNKMIRENSKSGLTHDDYNKKYGELMIRYERANEKQQDLIKSRNTKKSQAISLKAFISNLMKTDDKLQDWNEHVWLMLVKRAVVHRDDSITFIFYNGDETKLR